MNFLQSVSRKVTDGWELLSISSISSGSPFTVFSGIQQTGAGSNGVDRPDQIATPHLSTARNIRTDYFGKGTNNASRILLHPHSCRRRNRPEPGALWNAGTQHISGASVLQLRLCVHQGHAFRPTQSGAESIDLQFRGEFFNLFNIVNMGLPANILNGSGFGEITETAGTSRQIQLSLKLIY